jgi:putative spermidine/putrescine transport system permease protein
MGELEAVLSRAGEGDAIAPSARRRIDPYLLLVAPAGLLLLVCFGYPVLELLARSVLEPTVGLANYQRLIEQPLFVRVLGNTVAISCTVAGFCLLIGYPVAYTMARAGPRLRRLLIFVILVPFWTSILVRSFAWMVLLQKKGLINSMLLGLGLLQEPAQLAYNRIGVIIDMVQILLPFMIFPLYSVMARIDPIFSQAAATLGASPVRAFLRIYWPLSLPGVATGTVLVFVIALGYYITPALLGGIGDVMIAQLIQRQIGDFGNWGLAGALSAVLLAGTLLLLAAIHKSYRLGSGWKR